MANGLTDIRTQMRNTLIADPAAENLARVRDREQGMLSRLNINPNRLGGTLARSALGLVARTPEYARQGLGMQTPTERAAPQIQNILSNTTPGLPDSARYRSIQKIYEQQGMLGRAEQANQMAIAAEQMEIDRSIAQREMAAREQTADANTTSALASERNSFANLTNAEANLLGEQTEATAAALESGKQSDFYNTVAKVLDESDPIRAMLYRTAAVNNVDHTVLNQALTTLAVNRDDAKERELTERLSVSLGIDVAAADDLLYRLDNGLVETNVLEDGTTLVTLTDVALANSLGIDGSPARPAQLRINKGVYEPPKYTGKTIWEMKNYASGPINRLKRGINRVGPMFDDSFFDRNVAVTENLLNQMMLDLRSAAREELGAGRLSNQLIQTIDAEIGVQGGWIDTELNYAERLRVNANRLLNSQRQIEKDLEQGVYDGNATARTQARTSLSTISKAIQMLGVPELIATEEFTDDVIDTAPLAVLQESVMRMGVEEFNKIPAETAQRIFFRMFPEGTP